MATTSGDAVQDLQAIQASVASQPVPGDQSPGSVPNSVHEVPIFDGTLGTLVHMNGVGPPDTHPAVDAQQPVAAVAAVPVATPTTEEFGKQTFYGRLMTQFSTMGSIQSAAPQTVARQLAVP